MAESTTGNNYHETPSEPIARLIEELNRLPGIGPKSAQRLTFYLIRATREQAESLAKAVLDIKNKVVFCSRCLNITATNPCAICADPRRDVSAICVVEEPLDVMAIERTRAFRGLYHVLHGVISPMNGVG
ncbi:MAG: recombination protein RecR, partial [Chloroflexi bacterium]|nr:recombination protein RecR [Chloroflexota bacterium]